MADGVILPPSGTGDTNPKASTQQVTADQTHVQDVALATVVAGVRTRVSAASPVPVSNASLPLPTGASTETSVAASATALGAVGDSAYASGNGSVVAILKGLFAKLPALVGGRVPVDGSGVTQPVSGTVTTTPPANASTNVAQVAGTATDVNSGVKSAGTQRVVLATDQPALTNALKVDGSAVTQPVSGTVTTTPPANASTNLAQVAGTTPDTNSGSKSAGTLRVTLATDQVALTNALKVDPSAVTSPVSLASVPSHAVTNAGTFAVQDSQKVVDNAAFTDGTTPVQPVGFVFDEVAGTALTENDAAAARIDSKRAVIGAIEDATTRGQRLAVSAAGAAKVDGSAVTQPVSGTVTTTPPSNASSNVAQINGVTPLMGTGNTGTGSLRVTLATDQVALTNALKVDPSGVTSPVSLATPTSGGYSVSRLLSAATTNATSVKGSAGQVYGWYLGNAAAYDVFLKLYNKATSPTVGTDTPFMTIRVPAGAAANVEFMRGIAMGTGIAFAITKLVADADTTAVVANDLTVNLLYA